MVLVWSLHAAADGEGMWLWKPSPRSPPSQLWYSISAVTMQFIFAYGVSRFRDVFDVYDESLNRQKR